MKVSVCMITFNHERYIKESIESVLTQVADFEVELIIGEDCSADATRTICENYAARYPEKISLLTSDNNLGMMANFVRTLRACTGDYIAFIEGDDYWTDLAKLQKQADFLQKNPTFSACFHNVLNKSTRNGENKEWVLHDKLSKDVFTTEDVFNPWFIPSPSFMFVNYKDLVLPEWFYHCKYGDLPLMLLLSLRGPFKYLPEVMAVYRRHDAGMSIVHQQYDKIVVMLYIYESFNIHTNYKFATKAREAVIYELKTHLPKELFQITRPAPLRDRIKLRLKHFLS